MNIVMCIISVIIKIDGLNFYGKESLKGTVVSESKNKYIVDFTKSIDSRYVGSYSEVVVEKDECVKVK